MPERNPPARTVGPPPAAGPPPGGQPPRDAPAPTRFGRVVESSRGAFRIMGVLLLVAAGLALVATIALGILASRTRYFEQRNLRELDRIAAELSATSDSLGEVAALHFVPQQLHFSLSPMLECLVATTEVSGARQRRMTITYYFTDPEGTRRVAEWYAARAAALPGAGEEGQPRIESEGLPDGICSYRRPAGAAPTRTVAINGGVLSIERTARLTNLLWPMTARDRPESLTDCTVQRPAGNGGSGGMDGRDLIRRCFELAAIEDMADQTYSRRGGDTLAALVGQSLGAAFDSNAIHINVSTPMQAIGLESALDMFDAVQIIGHQAGHPDQPTLLFQGGRVPPAVEREQRLDRGLIGVLFGSDIAAEQIEANADDDGDDDEEEEGRRPFLSDSQVERRGDLVLFQRTVPQLAGMDCSPCRIVGIVDRTRFDRTVRKIDGVHATIFLILVLTMIGLIPLLQLRLRRRLDPTSRVGQYVLWFSLTLLSASAAVSALAIWSSTASRSAGSQYARAASATISHAFGDEMNATLSLIQSVVRDMRRSSVVFPAPSTEPAPPPEVQEDRERPAPENPPSQSERAVAESTPPAPATREADSPAPPAGTAAPSAGTAAEEAPAASGVAALQASWSAGKRAAIIETISHFRADGFIDRELPRLATGRLPAFGTSIASRSYFQRARNCDYDDLGGSGQEFILDRVFARPDGAPRVIWLLPTKRTCDRSALRSGPPGLAVVPTRRDYFYDPTQTSFLLASGSLRTFLGVQLAPGFDYAIVDPRRSGSEANVLFHSRQGAELVERFQSEIDNPEAFTAVVRELLTQAPDANAHRPGSEPVTARLDTNYRGQPARLTVSRLHDGLDWLLVVIENRNDAGYAIWRAASFGYGIWFAGALIVAALVLISHVRGSRGLDRRPGLWLWPQSRLADFTPPRLERHAKIRQWLSEAAAARDRHMWLVLLAGIVGVAAAEGSARVLFAFAASLAVMSARAYFRGLTSPDDRSARGLDRWMLLSTATLVAMAAIFFVAALADEYRFGNLGARGSAPAILLVVGRTALFAGAAVLILALLREAWPHSAETPAEVKVRGFGGRARRWDAGWMAALLILGGLPAFGGFVDSQDYDNRLVVERQTHLAREAEIERRQAATALINARIVPLPTAVTQGIVGEPLVPPSRLAATGPADGCLALSCLAIKYLGLREQALEFSDFAPFRMWDALGSRIEPLRIVGLLLLALLPLFGLWLVMVLFRSQYFRSPPLLSPGKDPEFDPPLSLTREQFIAHALLPAASKQAPALPFAPAGGGNLHLILGIGLDVRDDPAPGAAATPGQPTPRLGATQGIAWVDLLEEEKIVPDDAGAVVIGNLDLALQNPDEDALVDTYERIRGLAGTAGSRPSGRHVFILAETDPLDRIASLWNRQVEHDERQIEGWRWAELIQDFTLFPIRGPGRIPDVAPEPRLLRAIREELGVLDTRFAAELAAQLHRRMSAWLAGEADALPGGTATPADVAEGDRGVEALRQARETDEETARREEERMIAFITEQMSDHYHKLWASSSTEEQVILYRIAGDSHLKMHDSLALRALLSRGLLVRVPEYRLMNRSFARYVMRVGAPHEIKRSAEAVGGVDTIWPLIRYPLAAIAGSAVLLLQFVAPSNGSAAIGALPALVALVPALLGRWFQDRATVS